MITSLDDFSRFILYAILVAKETSWEHILTLEYVLLTYGIPLCYDEDSHFSLLLCPEQRFFLAQSLRIQLRMIPEKESGLSEVRFWHKDQFLGTQIVKNNDLNIVQF